MFLPSKHVPVDQALITVGAQILLQLDSPSSISSTWSKLNDWRDRNHMKSSVPFWWFALALDTLFAMHAIDHVNGELRRRSDAAYAH